MRGGCCLHINIRNSLLICVLGIWGSSSQAASSYASSFSLGVLGDFYMTEAAKDSSNGQLAGRFKFLYADNAKRSKVYIDAGAGGLVGEESESYVIIPQAYYEARIIDGAQHLGGDVNITAGRSVKKFSRLDEYWMLGEIQPLFRWDAMKPELQGLMGVFLETKSKNLEFTFYGSPIYLPTQGPSYKLINGKLTSGNPWFSEPVEQLISSNTVYDLRFDVNTPEVPDIIFQPNWGASAKVKSDNQVFWAQASYFKKARNEIILPFKPTLVLGSNIGRIEIFPRVAEHEVAALDLAAEGETLGIVLSGLSESNVVFEVDDPNWILPEYSDQYKVGAMTYWQLNSFHRMELGWLRTFKNKISIGGGLTGIDSLDAYDFRNQYNNVVDMRLTSVFSPRSHGFLFKTKIRGAYDYKAETTLISLDFDYTPISELSIFARADFLGGDEPVDVDYSDNIAQYLENDRAQVGVRYVF